MSERMATVLIVAITVLTVAACSWCFWPLPELGRPLLEIIPSVVDLGDVLLHDESDFEVELRNQGREALEISQVRADCNCANVTLDRSRLAPGHSASLRGTIRGSPKPGPIVRKILLSIDRPVPLQYAVAVVGHAHRRIKYVPANVVLQPEPLERRPAEAAVNVENASGQPVVLRVSECPQGVTACVETATVAPGATCRIQVQAAATTLTAREGELKVACSHPVENMLRIPIEVRPLCSLSVAPDAIAFGVLSRSELLATRSVTLQLSGDALGELDVAGVVAPAYLKFREVQKSDSANEQILFDLEDAFDRTDLGATVLVSLRDKRSMAAFQVEVPVSGFLTDAW